MTRSAYALSALFAITVLLYGVLAAQGPLPLLSPDETAVFALARRFLVTQSLSLGDMRALDSSWLHPRSFVVQGSQLLPVGFPLWMALLGLLGWMGGGAVLWVGVLVAASFVVPFVWLVERYARFSRTESLLVALGVACFPIAVLYGNRSLFTLMPQLALVAWSLWGFVGGSSVARLGVAGLGLALAVGLRPTEVVWIVPLVLLMLATKQERWSSKQWFAVAGGGMAGVGATLALHAWLYGAPWLIGYWLSSGGGVRAEAVAAPAVSVAQSSQGLFPYGFSLSHLRVNLTEAWSLGLWPWMFVWMVAGVWTCIEILRRQVSRAHIGVVSVLAWCTAWLLFYYGQGFYADHIGGQRMHLGNSFLRYLAPAMLGWMAYTAWFFMQKAHSRLVRVMVMVALAVSSIAGGTWALRDTEDGVVRGRREREHYAEVRAFVESTAPTSTIWLSERSDKMLVPARTAVSPLPTKAEVRALLERGHGPVWLYIRPPSQRQRDEWLAEGLELQEVRAYPRETIFAVRIREARQAP